MATKIASSGEEVCMKQSFGRSQFVRRHNGLNDDSVKEMVAALGLTDLDELLNKVVPEEVRTAEPLMLRSFPVAYSEYEALSNLKKIASKNIVGRSFLGMGYYDCITPPVIQRNILENPGWYTQYTPYQAEISQGRLEALLNFQTVIIELTGLPVANASLLDEATAAAEAMLMSWGVGSKSNPDGTRNEFLVASNVHPQTLGVLLTRAEPLGIDVRVISPDSFAFSERTFGCFLQYPDTRGTVCAIEDVISKAHAVGALATVATDLLSLCLLKPPSEFGADIVVGSAQRFGVPLGFGGPHAAFFATGEKFKRNIPGRIVGVSKDARGKAALRLALQTREQHIRREKATSNICTAQVLLAVMAGMYAVYHGARGLRRIAHRVHKLTCVCHALLRAGGVSVSKEPFFDTFTVDVGEQKSSGIRDEAEKIGLLMRVIDDRTVGLSFDEAKGVHDIVSILSVFGVVKSLEEVEEACDATPAIIPDSFLRTEAFLSQSVFNSHHSETEFLRYIKMLESRDLSLAHSMIPLGSCTMKLNATSEMVPVSWPEFSGIHPFAPQSHVGGYRKLFENLEQALSDCTGFAGCSLQPNAGSQGEYAGLIVIRAYHRSRGDMHRNVCLIPTSAHGTNPASAVMAGMQVVSVACDSAGNVDVADLKRKADHHRDELAALMVTYPSTHGVFESRITEVCSIVHECGGQVYMDGANLNALVGLVKPGEFGADVCHINLHKTFCIPHGGGGPGMGPICCAEHLKRFLPNHTMVDLGHEKGVGSISAAPWGSASILPISWMYMAMMGAEGLTVASQHAILSANYMAKRLENDYPVVYKGDDGFVAHECIINLQGLKEEANIEVEDVAKRLMDYGFHAPTVSWPVAGTLMIEPTESESKEEIDRFCDALIAIRQEVRDIAQGASDPVDNPLKNAPHTMLDVTADEWNRGYSRRTAAFPSPWLRDNKFWPAVGRVDGVYGDRNLFCSCDPLSEESTSEA